MDGDFKDFAQALAHALNPHTYWGKIELEATWPAPSDRFTKPVVKVTRSASVSINFTGDETPEQRAAMIYERENDARTMLREEVDNEVRLLWAAHLARVAELLPKPALKPKTDPAPRTTQPEQFPKPVNQAVVKTSASKVEPLRPGPAPEASADAAEEAYDLGADVAVGEDAESIMTKEGVVKGDHGANGWVLIERQPRQSEQAAGLMWGESIVSYVRGEFPNKDGSKKWTGMKIKCIHITGKEGGGTKEEIAERTVFESVIKGTPADKFFVKDGAQHAPEKPAFVMVGYDGSTYHNKHSNSDVLSLVALGVTLNPQTFVGPKNR